MTDEKDMEIDIKALARAHAQAAIQVLADIMTRPDAPAAARISAAKALLDRGFGKVTTQERKERPAQRNKSARWTELSEEGPASPGEEQILRIERVIIDPKEPGPENPSPEYPSEPCTYRGTNRPYYGWPPSAQQDVLGQQVKDKAQRAPPNVGDYADYTITGHDGWG